MFCSPTKVFVVLLFYGGGSWRFVMDCLFARCNASLTTWVCVYNISLLISLGGCYV